MTDTTLHFAFPSDLAHMRQVQGNLMEAVVQHGFDDEAQHAIRLALEEALINAIKHGNGGNAAKAVTVDAAITDKAVEFSISDQGCGFDRACVPDPTAEANLEKISGRGLLLIESYMSQVKYINHGRTLWMRRTK